MSRVVDFVQVRGTARSLFISRKEGVPAEARLERSGEFLRRRDLRSIPREGVRRRVLVRATDVFAGLLQTARLERSL